MSSRPANSAVELLEAEIALLIRRAEATRRAHPGQAQWALDRAAYVILRELDESGPVNVGTLASALGLDASTVTRQVSAMERAALVRRDRDPQDGRGTVISPTPSGLHRLRAVRRARADLYERALADWTEADRRTLATLLQRLNQTLHQARPSAPPSRRG